MATTQDLYEHLNTLTKQWFYDKNEIDTGYVAKSETSGLIKNDGTIDTNTYLTEHQDISGKANSADLHAVATSGSYTDLENIPETFAPSSHGHAASEITDSTAHSNLGTSANATQASINAAVDTKIGALLSVELVEVTTDKGTASASTMNKLYLVAESTAETNDAYEIFVTVRTGTSGNYSYAWEKVDTARIDLSGYATISHTHGNVTNDGKVGTAANKPLITGTGGAITAGEFEATATNIKMNGTQSVGSLNTFARGDHVHPTDTSRAAATHVHGNITNDGKIGSESGKVVVTTTGGALTTSTTIDEMDAAIQSLITYGESL